MKRVLSICFCLVCWGTLSAQEPNTVRGHFKVTQGDYIQLGYDLPKILTIGINTSDNKGRFGLRTYTYDNATSGFQMYNTTSFQNTFHLFIKDNGVVCVGTFFSILNNTANRDSMLSKPDVKLIVNGAFHTATPAFEYSDERLKENIKRLQNFNINDINVYSYNYKENIKDLELDNELHFGVRAQELQKIYPNLVIDSGDYLSVNYNQLLPILIETLQNQNKKIESLENILSKY